MKRLVCCLMSVVLAVGLMPLPAFAQGREGAAFEAARPSGLQSSPSQLGVQDVQAVSATLRDEKLFAAVREQLDDRKIAYVTDGESTISLDAENHARFTELKLVNKGLTSIEGLGAFTALQSLDLSHNLVSETASLSSLANLTELNLYDNAVHDFSGLAGLLQLKTLNLGENNEQAQGPLTGLAALENLSELSWLDFSENYCPDVIGRLAGLTKLEHLNLQRNKLTDVSSLANLNNMKTLILSSNNITDVGALGSMGRLEELNLQANNLYESNGGGINGLFDDAGALKLASLKKLDLWGNWQWTDGFMSGDGVGHMSTLFQMDQAGALELGYSYDRVKEYDQYATRNAKLADLPHTDAAGVKYVSYDDFGARGESGYDDFNAIRNAHRFANEAHCEVRATVGGADVARGKTYHIYRSYDLDYYNVYTDVDWQGATFVIHDENVDYLGARFAPLLCLRPSPSGLGQSAVAYDDIVTIPNAKPANPTEKQIDEIKANPHRYQSTLTLNAGRRLTKQTASIAGLSPEIDTALAALAEKGYSRMYVMAYNAEKKQYRRFGSNANTGSNQWDGFIVDSAGTLETASAERPAQQIQWDFDTLTSVAITPIPDEQSHVRNARFISTRVDSKTECPYGRGGSKQIYYLRNLQLRDCSNVEVSNITQEVGTAAGEIGDDDELSGSYTGFFTVNSCADVDVHDCSAWARRYDWAGRSTYGLTMNTTTNVTFTNFNCSNPWDQQLDIGGTRWGIMGTNHSKNVVFDHCTVNRIDAHEGFFNMTARDSKIGSWGFRLIGQGDLLIENCEVHSGNFIALRNDYGSTWDGDARIVNCKHYVRGIYSHSLVAFTPSYDGDGSVHDFGYELHFPNLEVENLTVDFGGWVDNDAYYIVPNFTYEGHESATRLPESYWPDVVDVRGVSIVNYGGSVHYKPLFRLVNVEEGTIAGKLFGYSASGVNFNGAGEHGDAATAGTQLLESERSIANEAFSVDLSLWDSLAGKDIAVQYAGKIPYMTLMDKGWHGWTGIYAYDIDRENKVAYFSGDTMRYLWGNKVGTTWTDSNGNTGTVVELGSIRVAADGDTTLKHVAILDAPTQPAHVHTWGEWQVTEPATCTAPGVRTRTCASDGASMSVRLSELGHDWESGYAVDVAPTCTESGSQSVHCSLCGERKDEAELSALGHDWGEWVVIVQPTYDTPGLEERTCKRDASHVEQREVAALVRGADEPPAGTDEPPASVEEPPAVTTGEAERTSVSAKVGKASVTVNVGSNGAATLTKAKSAKGTVKINTARTVDGRTVKVTAVAASAFKGSAATKVVLGANVKSVGKLAFQNCKKLKTVELGKNVKTVGASAFKGCKKLKTLKVRSAKLTRKSCKQMLKGSKVKTVKLVGMSKAQKKKAIAKYSKWIPKGVVVK